MKLNRAQLDVALSKVKPGLESGKEYQEQMKHVFFDGDDIATYNDHIAILIPFDVDFKTSVRFEDLYKAVHDSLLNEEEVDIRMEDKQLIIESNKTKVGLATMDYEKIDETLQGIKEQLPNDENGAKWISVPENFTTGLGLCVFAASTNMMLKGFTCVRVTNENLVASDNHRLSVFTFEKNAFDGKEFEFLIQAEDAKELVKFPVVEMHVGNKWCHFITDDDIVFSTKLVNEEFLVDNLSTLFKDVQALPKIEFPVSLKDKIENMLFLTSGDTQLDKFIDMEIDNNTLTCKASSERGWVEQTVDVQYSGEKIVLCLNPIFLSQVLSETTTASISKNRSFLQSGSFQHVLMHKAYMD
jgi:DNA polymerase III sliding clamp (beta) subunit (PCNA family)